MCPCLVQIALLMGLLDALTSVRYDRLSVDFGVQVRHDWLLGTRLHKRNATRLVLFACLLLLAIGPALLSEWCELLGSIQ